MPPSVWAKSALTERIRLGTRRLAQPIRTKLAHAIAASRRVAGTASPATTSIGSRSVAEEPTSRKDRGAAAHWACRAILSRGVAPLGCRRDGALPRPSLRRSSVVERAAVNRLVVGSNPTAGATFLIGWPYFRLLRATLDDPVDRVRDCHGDCQRLFIEGPVEKVGGEALLRLRGFVDGRRPGLARRLARAGPPDRGLRCRGLIRDQNADLVLAFDQRGDRDRLAAKLR